MQPDHKWRKYHSYSSIPHWLRAAPAEVSADISRYTYIAISAVSSSLFIGQDRRVPARQDARMPGCQGLGTRPRGGHWVPIVE